jgi:hypothetical protein
MRRMTKAGRCVFGPGAIFVHKELAYGIHFIPWDAYQGQIEPMQFNFEPPNLREDAIKDALLIIFRELTRLMGAVTMGLDAKLLRQLRRCYMPIFWLLTMGTFSEVGGKLYFSLKRVRLA